MLLSVRTFSRMLRMMVSSSDLALILGVGLARLSYIDLSHNHMDTVKGFWGGGQEVLTPAIRRAVSVQGCGETRIGATRRRRDRSHVYQLQRSRESLAARWFGANSLGYRSGAIIRREQNRDLFR